MRNITFAAATMEAMEETMAKDPKIFVMGEDIVKQGGIFGQFKGLADEFPGRVIDTPISETFIVGGGVGAALAGARPVVDLHYADFLGVCMDEVFNQMAKVRYMFGGQAKVSMVLRAPDGFMGLGAAQHSQYTDAWFMSIPGIKVVSTSNAYDAKRVLKAAIESDDPIIYFENKTLMKESFEVPEKSEEEQYEIGKGKLVSEGTDVTIVSYSMGMKYALETADILRKKNINAEVIDLISLSPWDRELVFSSAAKTHHLCIMHEAVKQGSVGAEIAAAAAEEIFGELHGPVLRYGAPFCPVPFSPALEKNVHLVPEKIAEDIIWQLKGM